MKTITLSETAYQGICEVLVDAINGRGVALEFLIVKCGLDSDLVQKEIAAMDRLDALETEFRAAGTAP